MEPMAAIALVLTTLGTLQKFAPIAQKVYELSKPLAIALYEKFTGKSISEEHRLILESKIDEFHLNFQRPIPPESER